MYVVQLIGRLAESVIELPYSAAQSGIAMGTCRLATDDEIKNAGIIPIEAPILVSDEIAMPDGYRFEPTEHGGYDLFDRGGVRLNEEPFPNIPAARSFALEHADAGLIRVNVSDQLNPEVQQGQLATRPVREFTLADYRAEPGEEEGTYNLFDVGGVKLNEEPLRSKEEAQALAQEHLDLALAQGEGPENDPGRGNEEDREVEVPANWQELHHMKRKAIARLIMGEEPPNTDAADAAIADYVLRQKGAVTA